jgi:hypothetical protein
MVHSMIEWTIPLPANSISSFGPRPKEGEKKARIVLFDGNYAVNGRKNTDVGRIFKEEKKKKPEK